MKINSLCRKDILNKIRTTKVDREKYRLLIALETIENLKVENDMPLYCNNIEVFPTSFLFTCSFRLRPTADDPRHVNYTFTFKYNPETVSIHFCNLVPGLILEVKDNTITLDDIITCIQFTVNAYNNDIDVLRSKFSSNKEEKDNE